MLQDNGIAGSAKYFGSSSILDYDLDLHLSLASPVYKTKKKNAARKAGFILIGVGTAQMIGDGILMISGNVTSTTDSQGNVMISPSDGKSLAGFAVLFNGAIMAGIGGSIFLYQLNKKFRR